MSPYASAGIEELLSAIRRELPTLRRMGVVRIGVFGSRARGDAQADSDVDLLVELQPGRDLVDLVMVKQHLEEALGLQVDVTTPSGLRGEDREAVMRDIRHAS